MRVLLDTDAMVASIALDHPQNRAASQLRDLISAGELKGFISTHALAEMYAILTRVPFQPRFTPGQVWQVIADDILPRFEVVPLDAQDYRKVIDDCARHQLLGGRIYDALHLAAARKAECDVIYTFNVRHFRELAPDLATRIRAPQLP